MPNDVQLLAFWAFEVSAGASIDLAAVEAAVGIAVGEQSDEFRAVFGGLALGQRRLLKHIAGTPVCGQRSARRVATRGLGLT